MKKAAIIFLCLFSAYLQGQTLWGGFRFDIKNSAGDTVSTTNLQAVKSFIGSSSGDITNGGNTTGATVVIGTNDANALELETNGVSRLAITGGASTGGATTITNVTANTNTVQDVLTVRANSTGTAAANFGTGLLFQGETSTTDNTDMVRLSSIWTTATHASRTSDLLFSGVYNAGAIGEMARFSNGIVPSLKIASAVGTPGTTSYYNSGITPGLNYKIGNTSSTIEISTSSLSEGAIILSPEVNTATSTAGIFIGNTLNLAQTSGTRNYMHFNYSFSPTSGTAVHNKLNFTGALNQTGGANGIVRGINLAHTMTAVADYRAIEIADNHANAHGIYQSGSSTKNVFVGKTGFGATTAPTALVMLAAGTATANTAPLKFTSGTNLTAVENGAVEYDGTDFTMTSESLRRNVLRSTTGRLTGQTAAASSVATLTVGAADATYMVSGNIMITTAGGSEAIALVVDYTDETNTARSYSIPILRISAGVWLNVTLGGSGTVPYPSAPIHIRCKASTTITIKTTGTFTSTTYNVEGTITKI